MPSENTTDIIALKKSISSIEDRLNCVIINKKISEYQTLISEYHNLVNSQANDELTQSSGVWGDPITITEDKLNEISTCKEEIKTLVWSSELLKCVCTIIKFNLL